MIRRPAHPVRLLATALTAGALLTTAACSDGAGDTPGAAQAASSPAAEPAAQTTSPTPSPSPGTLSEDGAQMALLTEADLEDDWQQVDDADQWQDELLIDDVDVDAFLTAQTDAEDCQQLLDNLYGEELLGKPSGASAFTGFEMGDSRLLEQVAVYDKDTLDDSMKWLKDLPTQCDEFTATDDAGDERTIQVVETSLPDVGDDRQGLEVTVRGQADGSPATLTLTVAAVRVGDNALNITGGGLDGGQKDSVEQGTEAGTQRLEDVLAGRTPSPQPTNAY
ncbi:hypothetical protein [Streptomyces poriticola]|uniref:hypothetical protein n=1 Tax=Streptomyces poriticola TaxID=3120506 RepID=UPI002FCE6264